MHDLVKLEHTLYQAAESGPAVRRLPSQRALDAALAPISPARLFWWCERRPSGPLYLLPTRELVRALAQWLSILAGPDGTVLEVGAGDGFLAQSLRGEGLAVTATDSGAWSEASARMTRAERHREAGRVQGLSLGAGVERLAALAAIRARQPTVVLASWLPPGPLFPQLVRAPCRYLVEIGVDGGITGQGEWGWRFAHESAPGAVERAARCRLDGAGRRRSTVTLYFGGAHPEFREERPRPDSPNGWLLRFKPAPRSN